MDIDWNRMNRYGADIGYASHSTVFFGNFSHVDEDGSIVLTDPENGKFVYISEDQIEEIEYAD